MNVLRKAQQDDLPLATKREPRSGVGARGWTGHVHGSTEPVLSSFLESIVSVAGD